jgi:hypothetical protein
MDVLMILSGDATPGLRAEIENRAKIVQEASPRVLVVSGDPAEIRRLATSPDVTSDEELAGPVGSAAHDRLTPSERLFVDAWIERRASAGQKRRVGEGLSWGAPGFEAP